MKYSKKWLQEYIKEELPKDEIIEAELNKKAFEVEGIEIFNYTNENGESVGDSIFDIKVLPNRAHDALGHIFMAKELCACLSLTFKNDLNNLLENFKENLKTNSDDVVNVKILDDKACTRFMAVKVGGVKVGETPKFIKDRLEAIGQKSINNIVDITNYVQFTLNKPMHAYDAKNIEGGIIVRYANEGEKLLTLDDKELELNVNTLVIADEKKPLGLAGIKGGKYSGIKNDTTEIIIESANFNSELIRKTSQKYNIKTDASKRFENGIHNSLVEIGLYYTLKLIEEYCTEENGNGEGVSISKVTDVGQKENKNRYFIGVTLNEINSVLGANYTKEKIEETFNKLNFEFEKINTLEFIKNNIEKVMGTKYKNPANVQNDAPEYFSCSSLVSYLFKGIWMPSLSVDKYVFCDKVSVGENIDESMLKYGDLIFANTGEGKIRYESVEYIRGEKVEAGVDHVGIYIGDAKILHSTKVRGETVIETFDEFKINRKVVGVGRVCDNLEEERYVVTIPKERLDLKIKENIIEEVGRIIGYDKLIPTLPSLQNKNTKNFLNKKLHYQNVIRNILFKNNFSEVMNYSFVEKGEVALLKAASTKNKMRTNISDGMTETVNKNISNMPLLKIDVVKCFEFGNVFTKEGEMNNLCIAFDDGKKKTNYMENVEMILSEIKSKLKIEKLEYEVKNTKPLIIEINFNDVLNVVSDEYVDEFVEDKYVDENVKFKEYSTMPFIIRDVAFWVGAGSELLLDNNKNILNIIKENSGANCIDVSKFDEFQKEIDGVKNVSLGYRLIYQSFEKTLTDEEVNKESDNVYNKLRELGLQIR